MFTKTRGRHHPDHAGIAEMREGTAENPAPVGQRVIEEQRSRLIQLRAYCLWEQAGKPDGDAAQERFWCEAEKEIMASYGRMNEGDENQL
jgi:hypothetical protein